MRLFKGIPKWDEVEWRKIDDDEYDRLKKRFPAFDTSICPTCSGTLKFRYHNRTWDCNCEVQRALARHYLYANISRTYHSLGFDDLREDKEDLGEVVHSFISNWDTYKRYGRGIIFMGGLGTGKTTAQVLLLKELIKKGEKVWFMTFTELTDAYMNTNNQKDEIYHEIQTAACVAVDEVPCGKSKDQKDFFEKVLEWAIRYRVENSLPTVMGTNLTEKGMTENYPRICSLVGMTYLLYEVDGEDVRKTTSKEQVEELIEKKEIRPVK